jgi:hypothetical protein
LRDLNSKNFEIERTTAADFCIFSFMHLLIVLKSLAVPKRVNFFSFSKPNSGPERGRERRDSFTGPGLEKWPGNHENKRKIGKSKDILLF